MNKKYKYELPVFLKGEISRDVYVKWLSHKSVAHVKRDKKRGFSNITVADYKVAVHNAVLKSRGFDAYTGWKLDWHLISTFNGEDAKRGRKEYMRRYFKLPTVDHKNDRHKVSDFEICSWIVNDCKSYLSLKEFKAVCKAVLKKGNFKK